MAMMLGAGQLDVIFAHWSGSWKSASPNMTVYDQASRRPIKRYAMCGKCGSRQFVLNKDQVALSNWSFSCAMRNEEPRPMD